MASQYTAQLQIILTLLEQQQQETKKNRNEILSSGQTAFHTALQIFPDESLVHAHALFAKLCIRYHDYEKALELLDEAIRRASLPLKSLQQSDDDVDDDDDVPLTSEQMESQSLLNQLILERNRAHYSHLSSRLDAWDAANVKYGKGGIPSQTSPREALTVVDAMLSIFEHPHPYTLWEKASFLVLLLDSPPEDDPEWNRTAKAWEAHGVYTAAQTWAFGAYTHGKKRGLAGGKPCTGKEEGFGVVVGGLGWSRTARTSRSFWDEATITATTRSPDGSNNIDDTFLGTVSFQNILLSGKDAILSGHGPNCQIYVPHRYVNLANNIPLVSSWESSLHELTLQDNPNWMTYIPSHDSQAYGGSMEENGLNIPDPKYHNLLDSVVLLTGYASDNYYHFVTEIVPSLIVMRKEVRRTLKKDMGDGCGKDVIVIPSLQHEFVEGYMKLLLPDAFSNGQPSKCLLEWGSGMEQRWNTTTATHSKYLTPHPIAYVKKLYAAIWDQPKEAPGPVFGPSHCLTPRPLLVAMRQAVWDAVDSYKSGYDGMTHSDSKLTVVYCPRSTSATRSLKEEEELSSHLYRVVSEHGGEVVIFEKKSNEESSNSSPLDFVIDSVELFRLANVVVGVHGAYILLLDCLQNRNAFSFIRF